MLTKTTKFFLLAVLVQLLLLWSVPARHIYTRLTGTPVSLRVRPVDPYSVLSGYYVDLNFRIAQPDVNKPWENYRYNSEIWVVLEKSPNGDYYQAVEVSTSRPKNLTDHQVAIKGTKRNRRIDYGIESYFIPEGVRGELNSKLRQASEDVRVLLKVDRYGNPALTGLEVNGKRY